MDAHSEQATRLGLYVLGLSLSTMSGATFTDKKSGAAAAPAPAAAAPAATPSSADEDELNALEARVRAQGEVVRTLKKEGKPFEAEVEKLAKLKAERDKVKERLDASKPKFDVDGFLNLLLRRMIVVPAFEIHGGVGGLMDFGPPGVGVKDNVVEFWKRHFIVRENMLQVETTNLTPHSVLLASGHVERFNDLLVEELNEQGVGTGDFHRADKILEAKIEQVLGELEGKIRAASAGERAALEAEADRLRKLGNAAGSLSVAEMDAQIKAFDIRGNPPLLRPLSAPRPFNLMFATTIGPSGQARAYLRPETAQGIFVNFRRLLDFNNGKLPFASAQVGTGFRNEIAPKGGLIRVREFTMAEIEHFVNPNKKQHPRFAEVADVVLQLFTAKAQTTTFKMEHMTARQAVDAGAINNETLAYFMARSQQFFVKIGVDPKRLRFRQHLRTEMAHYASDCYDAEILLAQGWLECAGHADRSCYDLEAHSKATGLELKASEPLAEPRIEVSESLAPKNGPIGMTFRKDAPAVVAALAALSPEQAQAAEAALAATGKYELRSADGAKTFTITRDMAAFARVERKVHEDRYYPAVIEPSFGVGRIVHSVLEHAYWVRPESAAAVTAEDGDRDLGKVVRNVLSLRPLVAPFKCGFIPYGASFDVDGCRAAMALLNDAGLPAVIDTSGVSIGRKYARFDEIGVPFAITFDDQTAADKSFTLRERDTEEQIRVPGSIDLVATLRGLVEDRITWAALRTQYPVVRPAASAGRPQV